MARHLGEPVLLLDPNGGPAAVAAGAGATPRAQLGCDLVVLADVGGDVLAHGDEAGLASPLADAVCLAAAPALADAGVGVLWRVFGAGCDGELTPAEVLERVAEVAARRRATSAPGARAGASSTRLEAAVAADPDGGQRDGAALRARRDRRDADPRRPPHACS